MKIISIPDCGEIGKGISEPTQEILGRFYSLGAKFIEVEEEGERSFREIVRMNDADNPYFLKEAKVEQVDNSIATRRGGDE
jgi:hypothetical protein